MDINYEIGTKLARNGKFKESYRYLIESVEQNNADAANDLGVVFEHMDNYKLALDFYKKAIKLGSVAAIYNVGNLYENGLGVHMDFNKAKQFYERAAKLNYSNAYHKLSKLYYYGMGVERDYDKSFKLLEDGQVLEDKNDYANTYCITSLAHRYFRGEGVDKDVKKAYDLWKLAARHGNIWAMYNVAVGMLFGDQMPKDPDTAIKTFIRLAIDEGCGDAMRILWKIFERGEFVKKNLFEAGSWILRSASNGDPAAFLKIALICLSGRDKRYGFKAGCLEKAIVDFNIATFGKEMEYIEEINVYKKLRERYPDKIDWDYLETMPNLKEKRDNKDICSC